MQAILLSGVNLNARNSMFKDWCILTAEMYTGFPCNIEFYIEIEYWR